MTLLANGSLKDGSSQYYSSKLHRNDSTQQLLRPFTPDQLRENYCQNNTKFKINTSQSEKILIWGPKIIYSQSNWTSAIITINTNYLKLLLKTTSLQLLIASEEYVFSPKYIKKTRKRKVHFVRHNTWCSWVRPETWNREAVWNCSLKSTQHQMV